MKKISEIYKELGIAFKYPIVIRDRNGNETYRENYDGLWVMHEYDDHGNQTYFENSFGAKRGTPKRQSCDGKVIEVDGKKYQLKEL